MIAWRARVGIQGYANTPLIGDDAVYLTSQGTDHNHGDPEDGFYALDRETGARLWFAATGEDINGGVLTDTLVVGGSDSGALYAVDRRSGELRWRAELHEPIHHGPLVVGSRLILTTRDGVAIVDAASGQVMGRLSGSADGWSPRGGLALTGSLLVRTAQACALEAWQDEEPLWGRAACEPAMGAWNDETYVPPVLVGTGALVHAVRGAEHEGIVTELGLFDAETGARRWTTRVEDDHAALGTRRGQPGYELHYNTTTPWLMGGLVFVPRVTGPYVMAFELATGQPSRAIELPTCRGRQFGSIVGVPSRGYLPRHDGRLYAFAPATGQVSWVMNLQHEGSAGRVVGAALDADEQFGHQYCYADPYDGTALFSTPAIADDGALIVGSGEGFVYAIRDASW